jgi:hypothetical protein
LTKERQEQLETIQPGINAYRALTECLDAIRQRDSQLTAALGRERVLKEKVEHWKNMAMKFSVDEAGLCQRCFNWDGEHAANCETGQALSETEEKK